MKGNYGGYDGPCPPWNDAIVHHYHFRVYALDLESLGLDGVFGGPEAVAAMDALQNPDVTWSEDGSPRSRRFDDVYYASGGGLAETKHVFLDGADLPQAWRGRDRFVVGETGFGTGLNFLATWRLWRETAEAGQRLQFSSRLKGFPWNPKISSGPTGLTERWRNSPEGWPPNTRRGIPASIFWKGLS